MRRIQTLWSLPGFASFQGSQLQLGRSLQEAKLQRPPWPAWSLLKPGLLAEPDSLCSEQQAPTTCEVVNAYIGVLLDAEDKEGHWSKIMVHKSGLCKKCSRPVYRGASICLEGDALYYGYLKCLCMAVKSTIGISQLPD